jgi:hypothetical protein
MKSRCTSALLIALLTLTAVSCTRAGLSPRPTHAKEVANLLPVANDPALRPQGFDPTVKPPGPPVIDKSEEGALYTKIQWSPISQFPLNSGQSHLITAAMPGAGTVFGRLSWSGGAGPVPFREKVSEVSHPAGPGPRSAGKIKEGTQVVPHIYTCFYPAFVPTLSGTHPLGRKQEPKKSSSGE